MHTYLLKECTDKVKRGQYAEPLSVTTETLTHLDQSSIEGMLFESNRITLEIQIILAHPIDTTEEQVRKLLDSLDRLLSRTKGFEKKSPLIKRITLCAMGNSILLHRLRRRTELSDAMLSRCLQLLNVEGTTQEEFVEAILKNVHHSFTSNRYDPTHNVFIALWMSSLLHDSKWSRYIHQTRMSDMEELLCEGSKSWKIGMEKLAGRDIKGAIKYLTRSYDDDARDRQKLIRII
ncbi:hypothetical protein PROFUN_06611, partial [Planoprotostelium fungivorum]